MFRVKVLQLIEASSSLGVSLLAVSLRPSQKLLVKVAYLWDGPTPPDVGSNPAAALEFESCRWIGPERGSSSFFEPKPRVSHIAFLLLVNVGAGIGLFNSL